MKKVIFLFVVCLFSVSPLLAGDYSGTVGQIYSNEETGVYRVTLSSTPGVWLVLKESVAGAANIERMHLQLLSALVSGKTVWIGTCGSSYDIWATTIYR